MAQDSSNFLSTRRTLAQEGVEAGKRIRKIAFDVGVRLYQVEVQEPDIYDPSSDLRRLKEALEFEWRLTNLCCEVQVLQQLQQALRKGDWKVTVAVHADRQIIAVWASLKGKIYGLSLKVSSTNATAHLYDLSSGEAVAAEAMGHQVGGELLTTQVVRQTIDTIGMKIAARVNINMTDILGVNLVSSPSVHHLLLGINPVESSDLLFALATDEPITLRAAELGLHIHPNARICVMPCSAGIRPQNVLKR